MRLPIKPLTSHISEMMETNEHFISHDSIVWLEEYVGSIINERNFSKRGEFEFEGEVSVMAFMRKAGDFYNERTKKNIPVEIGPLIVSHIIEANGWRYERTFFWDSRRTNLDFKSKEPKDGCVHILEIDDDDLAFQFRLAWM